jgi:membrane AbrB-like protein
MGVPRWFHIIIVLGVGVIVGAMFGPDTLENMLDWIYTVSAMLVSSIIATSVSYWYLTRRRNYDPPLALFCALPGGQAEVILVSREYVEKDYVVALCHLVRVVVIFCSVPLTLAFVLGESAVRDSNKALSDLPGLMDVPMLVLVQFVTLALVGYALARILRTPVPFLLGPMLLSMGLHLTGIINIPRINEVVFLAQITVGGTVGARLGQVKFGILAGYLRDALVNVVLVLSIFVSSAYLIASWIELEFFDVMLAFVPGGLYEITLLSLIFGFDVAFVVIHHSTRMLSLLFALPFLLKLLPAREQK